MLEDYEKQKKAMEKSLKAIAKESKSVAAKNLTKEDKGSGEGKMLAHDLLSESLDLFSSGEMSWEEAVDDLSLALKAIKMEEED